MKSIIYLVLLLFISFTLSSCNDENVKTEKEYNELVSFLTDQNIKQAAIQFYSLEKRHHDNPRKLKVYYDEVLKANGYINHFLAKKNEIIKKKDYSEEILRDTYQVYMDSILSIFDAYIQFERMEIPTYPLMNKEKLSFNEMMLNISYYKLYLIEISLASTDASNCWGYVGIADLSAEECINKEDNGYSISINSTLFDNYFPIKYVFVDSILTSAKTSPTYSIERKDTFAQVNLDSIGNESYEVYLKVLGFMQDGRKYEWQLKHKIDKRKEVRN